MNWKPSLGRSRRSPPRALGASANPAAAGRRKTDVAIALVLAVDTSGSVSAGRFELQKQGYAAAFRNPQVLNSIRSLATQSIAVTMMQWTGPRLHVVVVDWTLIKDEASANALRRRDRSAPRANCSAAAPRSAAPSIIPALLLAQSPFNGGASRHRHFRRRFQQQRPSGDPGPRRGGARRRRHQRPADPLDRARSRPLLL